MSLSLVRKTSSRLVLSPDQTRALVTNTSGGLIVYDLPSAHVVSCARDVQGLDRGSPVAFVHGGNAMLVGCKDGQAKLFDSRSAVCLQTLNHEGQRTTSDNGLETANCLAGGGDIVAAAVCGHCFRAQLSCLDTDRSTLPFRTSPS